MFANKQDIENYEKRTNTPDSSQGHVTIFFIPRPYPEIDGTFLINIHHT
jgi:hypothetical protein